MPEQDLIIDNQLNPKAIRVLKIIFNKSATQNGEMSKDDYNQFTAQCLATYSKKYYDKIIPLYNKYDSNQDGLLSFEDFLKFYTDASIDKPSTVWSNLKSFNVKGNFKFKDEPEIKIDQQQLPRLKLYEN